MFPCSTDRMRRTVPTLSCREKKMSLALLHGSGRRWHSPFPKR